MKKRVLVSVLAAAAMVLSLMAASLPASADSPEVGYNVLDSWPVSDIGNVTNTGAFGGWSVWMGAANNGTLSADSAYEKPPGVTTPNTARVSHIDYVNLYCYGANRASASPALVGGEKYRASVWVKKEAVSDAVYININYGGNVKDTVFIIGSEATDGWVELSKIIRLRDSFSQVQFEIEFQGNSSGSYVYINNPTLIKLDSAPPSGAIPGEPAPAEDGSALLAGNETAAPVSGLLAAPGFEEDNAFNAANWNVWSAAKYLMGDKEVSASGEWVKAGAKALWVNSPSAETFTVYQEMKLASASPAVKQGGKYLVTFWTRQYELTGDVSVAVEYKNLDGDVTVNTKALTIEETTGGWVKYGIRFDAPQWDGGMEMFCPTFFSVSFNGSTGQFWMDDIQIFEISLPGETGETGEAGETGETGEPGGSPSTAPGQTDGGSGRNPASGEPSPAMPALVVTAFCGLALIISKKRKTA